MKSGTIVSISMPHRLFSESRFPPFGPMLYLKTQNPQAARGLQERILDIVAQLHAHPYSARRTSRPNIRRVPLGTYPYLLDDSADESEIVVRRLRHASRRPLA